MLCPCQEFVTIVVRQDCSGSASLETPDDEYEYHGQDWEDAADSGLKGDVAGGSSEKTCLASENVYTSILRTMEVKGEQCEGTKPGGANKSVFALRDDGPFEVRSLHLHPRNSLTLVLLFVTHTHMHTCSSLSRTHMIRIHTRTL